MAGFFDQIIRDSRRSVGLSLGTPQEPTHPLDRGMSVDALPPAGENDAGTPYRWENTNPVGGRESVEPGKRGLGIESSLVDVKHVIHTPDDPGTAPTPLVAASVAPDSGDSGKDHQTGRFSDAVMPGENTMPGAVSASAGAAIRDTALAPDNPGAGACPGTPAGHELAGEAAADTSNTIITDNSTPIPAWEEGDRWKRAAAFQTPTSQPAARQVVDPWPLEPTGDAALPEATERNFPFPNPVTQKLKVIGRASMVRESRSCAVESAGQQLRDLKDSCAEMPLATREELSTRGESVATQGRRPAGHPTRAGATTPPDLFPPGASDQQSAGEESPPNRQAIAATPFLPPPPSEKKTSDSISDRPQSKPKPSKPTPDQCGSRVQIGLLEIVIVSPESRGTVTSAPGRQPRANLASRHYLRNL